jgi:hypothetical protein
VRSTDPPSQNVVGPPGEIETDGLALTVIVIAVGVSREHPALEITQV